MCPEVRRRQHRHNFKFDQIFPPGDPGVEQFLVGCFHDLETARASRIDPTGMVGDAFGSMRPLR